MRKLVLTTALLFLISSLSFGQTLGTITGEIRDPSGAVVPNATVTATNTSTNAIRTTVTNSVGLYSFPALNPGPYEVKVEVAGFRTSASKLELQVQQTARVDLNLQVGQSTESVEVSAQSAMLATENATVGTVIDNRRIVELPLNGRNFLQLIALSPNVTSGFASAGQATGRQGGDRANQNYSLAGQRGGWNRYTLDGIEDTDVNFNLYVVLPSVEALQEFKVQQGIYPAEFGRAASQINVSTKPGTNTYHGALFEFMRNDRLDARQYDFIGTTPVKQPFKWNQYGFTLSGPVGIPKVFTAKDRLFFMSNYEGYRNRRTRNSTMSVATDAMRNGDFSQLLPGTQLYYPDGRSLGTDGKTIIATPIPGNVIPKNRLDPISLRLLQYYPTTNVASANPLRDNFQTQLKNTIDKDQFTLRLDAIESNSSNWFGRYSWTDEKSVDAGVLKSGSLAYTRASQWALSNNRIISATQVNEFRFGVNSFFNNFGQEMASIQNVNAFLNIPGLETPDPLVWGIPNVRNLGGLSGFGSSPNGPFVVADTTFQVIDNYSIMRGKHSFRFGAEVRRDRFNQLGNEFARGVLNFEGIATKSGTGAGGYGFADLMLGYMTRGEAALGLAFHQFRATSQYYYIDDTWRVSPTLTINMGLRYEYNPPWDDISQSIANTYMPFIANFSGVSDPKLHPVLLRPGSGDFYEGKRIRFPAAVQVARDGRFGNTMVIPDKNDFAPRLGIAWTPSPKWSIRTGGGWFYSVESGNSKFDLARTLPGRQTAVANSSYPDITYANMMPPPGQYGIITNPYVYGYQVNNRTTYTMQWLLNIQRELGESSMIEIGYNGSRSLRLQSLFEGNETDPGPGPVYLKSSFQEYGRIQTVDGNGQGRYNGLGVKFNRRFSGGLTYLIGYTWSKSMDTASAIRGAGDGIFPNNSRCNIVCEYGPSSFNTPHRLVSSIMYELPFGKGRKYLNQSGIGGALLNGVVGGWQVGSIITMESGRPMNPNVSGDQSNSGGGNGEDRLNATGVSWKLEERTTNKWFNTAAFQLQDFGTFGNAGRNVMIGPSAFSWDFSAHKSFRIVEGHELNFRFEAFNLPNHPNWGNPSAAWGSTNVKQPGPNYGRITSTRSMREMQMGLRYSF